MGIRDNVNLRCYYFLCEYHKEDDYCSLPLVIMGTWDTEGYITPVCMNCKDKEHKRGLGFYEVIENDGTTKRYDI